jgi:hypothetical protein
VTVVVAAGVGVGVAARMVVAEDAAEMRKTNPTIADTTGLSIRPPFTRLPGSKKLA